MKNRIRNILKNNIFIYKIYMILGSLIINIFKIFIKVDDNIILMNSFGGKKYDDSTRVIYEYMRTQDKYKKYKIYWALNNPDEFIIDGAIKIKTDTIKYFYIALKAKYWITNSAIERGLAFKNKKTIYINTWHGTALKKMGSDAPNTAFKFNSSKYNVMYAQSNYDIKVFSKAFNLPKEIFALVGLPRNDELANISYDECKKIKSKLNIKDNKKIILYAPTFRDYNKNENGCIITPLIDIEKWKTKLSDKYVILFRAHYEIAQTLGINNDNFFYDVSDYNNLNELMKVSDMLITDYSSIMFDYSILERPIYCYAYDYEEYKEKRGMYFDIATELPNGYTENEDILLGQILNCNFKEQKEKTIKFKNKYVEEYGNARKYIDKIIN